LLNYSFIKNIYQQIKGCLNRNKYIKYQYTRYIYLFYPE
jgi:hypothetical protein